MSFSLTRSCTSPSQSSRPSRKSLIDPHSVLKTELPKGRSLKKADVAKALLDWDVFINIPIAKDHTGLGFTGTMKNMMGLTSSTTNMFFHHGLGKLGWYGDGDFLAQCIADVNLVRKPDLCNFDGTEVLATNGPRGPGRWSTAGRNWS